VQSSGETRERSWPDRIPIAAGLLDFHRRSGPSHSGAHKMCVAVLVRANKHFCSKVDISDAHVFLEIGGRILMNTLELI
jgi:hypothetical protein